MGFVTYLGFVTGLGVCHILAGFVTGFVIISIWPSAIIIRTLVIRVLGFVTWVGIYRILMGFVTGFVNYL